MKWFVIAFLLFTVPLLTRAMLGPDPFRNESQVQRSLKEAGQFR
jgi:hypothetical protein